MVFLQGLLLYSFLPTVQPNPTLRCFYVATPGHTDAVLVSHIVNLGYKTGNLRS